jgi:hypothetical protein
MALATSSLEPPPLVPLVSRRKRRPKLRTILLLMNLLVLALPLFGIGLLRLVETELLRATEAELIAQAAFVAAAYQEAVAGLPDVALAAIGHPVAAVDTLDENAVPPQPQLDFARDGVLPMAGDAEVPQAPAAPGPWLREGASCARWRALSA